MIIDINMITWKLSRMDWIEQLYKSGRLNRFDALLLAQNLKLISPIEAMYLNK
jgi:hypothetical protein